jgi:hypothetical protein
MNLAEQHAERLLDRARDEHDIRAAELLRQFGRVHAVAREMVYANTHEQSKAAYVEMIDLIKGKAD